MYKLNQYKLIENVKKRSPKIVILQLPEGLKVYGRSLARMIEREVGCQIVISTDPCYGACDLALEPMRLLNADLLIHFGHTQMSTGDDPKILYVESTSTIDIEGPLEEAINLLKVKGSENVGLAATVQHIDKLDFTKKALEKAGVKAHIGKAGGKVKYNGQVLGCDFETAISVSDKVDSFLLISGGEFHGIGVNLATGKRTIILDPYLSKSIDITEKGKRNLKLIRAALGKFLQSYKIAIVIGLKSGQNRFKDAIDLKEILENRGKECVLLCAREITPESLNSFTDFDVIVNTACPRIAIDDLKQFIKPIVNIIDVKNILKESDGLFNVQNR